MSRSIQIELAPIHYLLSSPESSDRKEQIALRKQAIYRFRNQLITTQLNHKVDDQDFHRNQFGKPFLTAFENFYFNHSHSHKVYALASSHAIKDIGVDVEDLDRKVRFDALAKHAFHPDEYQRWKSLGFDPRYWFKVWTTKEAILKASGLGIRLDLNSLNTQVHTEHNGGICEHDVLGVFAYQNYELMNSILSVAWRSSYSCKGFAWPEIKIHQHG